MEAVRKMSRAQKKWCREYERITGFEAMHMDEYEAGQVEFKELVQRNVKWFEDWSSDSYLTVSSLPYPGMFKD